MDSPSLANAWGVISLIAYIITLIPGIIKILFPTVKKTRIYRQLLKYRREIGVIAFFCALAHAYLMMQRRRFDLVDSSTLLLNFEGMVTLAVFALLAITSNNFSVRRLRKNWKRLHRLTYGAMFLLAWHVLVKMAGHWSWATPLSAIAIVAITVLFLVRKGLEVYGIKQLGPQRSDPV